MDTPISRFLQAVGPSLKDIAAETGVSYGYLRLLAAGSQAAGADTARLVLAWGDAHLPKAQAALDALRATVPAEASAAEPSSPPPPESPPEKAIRSEPVREPIPKEKSARRPKRS